MLGRKIMDTINIFKEPLSMEEIKERYTYLHERYEENSFLDTIICLLPPFVDLAFLPIALTADLAATSIKMTIDSFSFSETDKNMYAFVNNTIRDNYECEKYSAIKNYIEKVKLQGRPLTVGEIKMFENYKNSMNSTSEIGKNVLKSIL